MFTKLVNNPGTLTGIPNPLPRLDLRQVWYRPNHGFRPPYPPQAEVSYMSYPLLTFFTPLAPICRFPPPKPVSHFLERDWFRVSPAGTPLFPATYPLWAPGLRSPGHW